MDELEGKFDRAMMEIYERAGREVGYWATRYLQMLRARGGIETARRLIHARATSDGYARLRDAGRLDLTVEAYSLRPEFRTLFTPEELNMARERLEYFRRPLDLEADLPEDVDPDLVALLDEAARAQPERRIDYRDRVATYGSVAIPALEAWTGQGLSPGFVSAVLEVIAQDANRADVINALKRLRSRNQGWAGVIDASISRIQGS